MVFVKIFVKIFVNFSIFVADGLEILAGKNLGNCDQKSREVACVMCKHSNFRWILEFVRTCSFSQLSSKEPTDLDVSAPHQAGEYQVGQNSFDTR